MLQVGSLQPPAQVMILEKNSIICKSNDPQIFHLQKTEKLVALQIIHEAWHMLWDYLVVCPLSVNLHPVSYRHFGVKWALCMLAWAEDLRRHVRLS